MRKIRIENLKAQNLVHIVEAFKFKVMFLLGKEIFEKLKKEATSFDEMEMSFITQNGDFSIETVIEFEKFCDQFYRIDNVTVNGNLIYGYSSWSSITEQVVIEAE